MTRSSRSGTALALALLTLGLGISSAVRAEIHALLVGSSTYPFLASRWQLDGPPHDVELLGEVLVREFGVDEARITRLAGWPEEVSARPSRANIEAAFARLAKTVEAGDQVVILLAGHGSQQPADEDPGDPESDGLDEIFLPGDVGHWNGKIGTVERAIVDDELRTWLEAIRREGAFVWLLVDACHSGTLTRGSERSRSLSPTELGISAEALARTGRSRGGERERRIVDLGDEAGGLVAMYAAQPWEVTPEKVLPYPDGLYHGLFTYTVAQVLSESDGPLSYRDLAAAVAARYRGQQRTSPTPLLEGGGIDREVLGLTEWPRGPRFELRVGAGRVGLEAGDLDGLTVGSVLSIHPPAGVEAPDRILGHARVVRVTPMASELEPVVATEAGWEVPDEPPAWPDGARASVAWVDFGELAMRVGLQRETGDGTLTMLPAGAGPEAVEKALTELVGPGGLVARVPEAEAAQWLVRLVGGEVVLVPASGWVDPRGGDEGVPIAFRLGPLEGSTDLATRLASALRRIARAAHLVGLSDPLPRDRGPVEEARVEVRIVRYAGPDDRAGEVVVPGREGRILHPGEHVAFEIGNPTKGPLDVTLLFVDSGYGITALFPDPGTTNRLGPGETIRVYRTRVSADTVGEEQVVAIAVRGEGPTRSFASLAQPTLEAYRQVERSRGTRGSGRSPLEQLMETALYGSGTTRGLGGPEAKSYAVAVVPWLTLPGPAVD